jgi:hypothetical protein
MVLNWKRAKPRKPTEDQMGEGFKRKDGRVTPNLPKDSLAKRAAVAEAKWLRANKLEVRPNGYIASKRRR